MINDAAKGLQAGSTLVAANTSRCLTCTSKTGCPRDDPSHQPRGRPGSLLPAPGSGHDERSFTIRICARRRRVRRSRSAAEFERRSLRDRRIAARRLSRSTTPAYRENPISRMGAAGFLAVSMPVCWSVCCTEKPRQHCPRRWYSVTDPTRSFFVNCDY